VLKILWRKFPKRRQRHFYFLLILMILSSFAEVVSIGAVLPFLGVLTAPDQIFQHSIFQPFVQFLKLTESSQLILPVTIIFIAAVLVSSAIRLLLLYVMTRLSYAAGSDISIDIYRRTLYQGYLVHVSRNSSEIINSITRKAKAVSGSFIMPILSIISSVMMIVSILSALLIIDTAITLSVFMGFGILYWIIAFYNRVQVKNNSKCIASQSTLMIKSLQEGLGGIRDVLIDGSQEFYCSIFRNSETELRKAAAKNKFIGASPRYVMEAIGMTLIAIFAYIATQEQGGVGTVIPVLGTLALAAQRVLPAIQQIYSSYNSIKGSKYSLKDVIALLEQQLPYYSSEMPPIPIKFNKSIVLKNISFRYRSDLPWVLKDFNLTLNKSKHIGFIGVTGSGKSTLLDIVMGLLSQTQGEMLIDDQVITNKNYRSWQAHIAHVPQSVYLSDNSIEENIAFGSAIEKIDGNRVIKAAKQAQILELVESLPDGFQTRIGERGVRLSGGQRQRIGIARALYKRASVLIFDEATSALDNETESSIMQTIKNLDKDLTVLIIAHRLTTLKDCDQIVKLGVNNTVEILEYKEII